jgi:DNA-binding SARP family transcriptional activator
MRVSFHVLGAVAARVDDDDLRIAAPRQRALLARLLVDANQTITTSELIDAIWGSAPPQHPESALHIVVSRLRRALEAAAPRLVRARLGYRIDVAPNELDLTRAQALLAKAQCATRERDATRAALLLDEAIACWSGQPLSDVANFPFYDAAARQLREFRVGLVELRYSAYLHCGRDLEVLDDIDAWVRSDPWRERLRAQQMVALYRSGRQIDALAAYDDLRRRLVTDFGVNPCDEVQQLHSRILRQDPLLLEDPAGTGGAIGTSIVPPARPGDASLDDLLVARLRQIAVDPADVVIVEGGPGIDRDWLVVEIPRRERGDRKDDVYVSDSLPRRPLGDSLATAWEWLAGDPAPTNQGASSASSG